MSYTGFTAFYRKIRERTDIGILILLLPLTAGIAEGTARADDSGYGELACYSSLSASNSCQDDELYYGVCKVTDIFGNGPYTIKEVTPNYLMKALTSLAVSYMKTTPQCKPAQDYIMRMINAHLIYSVDQEYKEQAASLPVKSRGNQYVIFLRHDLFETAWSSDHTAALEQYNSLAKDIAWLLLHEAGHKVLGHMDGVGLASYLTGYTDQQEAAADQFSRDCVATNTPGPRLKAWEAYLRCRVRRNC